METRSRKRLRLGDSLANITREDEEQNVTNSNPRLNTKTEHQHFFDNTGSDMNVPDIVKLYDNGEYTQEMLDQALSVQERFIFIHLSTTLDRVISFLFKCELTKVVDIRKTAIKCNCDGCDLMKYYKIASIVFPQILAQLCPNITEFRKMNLSNSTHVAFFNDYKKNIPKYSETGVESIPKNKFAGYMDVFVHRMPHLMEMMISKIGVYDVKVMMEAFDCNQETIDSMFNLVKEFKIKINGTNLTNKQRNQKIEETIALLLKCPNTKIIDISLVTEKYIPWNDASPIVKFFNSMPSSFTQAFAQLCPRIEQISDGGELIFDTKLFASYARSTNGRCNLTHINLIGYREYSKMQRQRLLHYIDSCSKIKSLEISFDVCNFLMEGRRIEADKNLLDKLKHVEEMKLHSKHYWLDNNDFINMFVKLKKLDLRIDYLTHWITDINIVKETFTAINSLPSLTSLDLYFEYNTCLEFIRPSLVKKLTVGDMRFTRPEELNSITNLSNLQSLTLIRARNNIIPLVSQLNLTILLNLKHIQIRYFTGDCKQLFSAAITLSQNIKFDFCGRMNTTSSRDVIRDVIDARHTVFNKILLESDNSIIKNDHAILHEAITKLDSSRVRNSFHLLVSQECMKVVQRCKVCQQLLVNNTIFNIYKQ